MTTYSTHHFWEERSFLQDGFFFQWDGRWDLVTWGRPRWSHLPQTDQISCYIPDFYRENDKPWCIFEHGGLFEKRGSNGLQKNFQKTQGMKRVWQEPSLEEFSHVFNQVQSQISARELTKAVPVVFAVSDGEISEQEKRRALEPTHSLEWPKYYGWWSEGFKEELPAPKDAEWPKYYGWWSEGEGVLGCTPELLFSYEPGDQKIKTMALAGTKRPGEGSLLNDPKERWEHQLVIEAITKNLRKMGPVHIGETMEWDSGLIQHLRTDIEVKVKGLFDFNRLCEWIHPTPALGLSSETLHWKWLKKIDSSVPRKRFGAPFGVLLPDGRAKALVAIRNIQWFDGKSYLGSGCGIVKQSKLHHEWKELSIKRNSVLQSLGIE